MSTYFDDYDFHNDTNLEEDESEDENEEESEEEKYDDKDEVYEDEDDIDDDDDDDDDYEEEENEEQEGGAGDSDLEEDNISEDDIGETNIKQSKKVKKIPSKNVYKKPSDYIDDEDEDDDGEQYLQKFDKTVNDNYILNYHPESATQNYDEILNMSRVVRNADGIIIDKLHKTIPYLTKYEKARILGQRTKQINSGAFPFVKVPENVIDGYLIAELELKQKRIPFIIRRPLPNGGSEYWNVKDLEDIMF